jgi:hypothetical protein
MYFEFCKGRILKKEFYRGGRGEEKRERLWLAESAPEAYDNPSGGQRID